MVSVRCNMDRLRGEICRLVTQSGAHALSTPHPTDRRDICKLQHLDVRAVDPDPTPEGGRSRTRHSARKSLRPLSALVGCAGTLAPWPRSLQPRYRPGNPDRILRTPT